MNSKNAALATSLVPTTYIQQGVDAIRNRENLITALLSQRRVPDIGWDELNIEMLLQTLASMDSNNFRTNAGAGEREARIYSSIVAKRHFYLCHGVGRSGDVTAVQPKAAGSSLIVQLANNMAKDILKESGLALIKAAVILPVATGMSISLTLLALKQRKPAAKFVIWPRIDQKSCFKAILTAGLIPLIISNKLNETGSLHTDVDKIQTVINEYGEESILCILSTTTCFAPRVYDNVKELAQICKQNNIFHVINNAYGVQSSKCTHMITEAMGIGIVDAVIQSLDKNFMMPVGGAIVCSPSKHVIEALAQYYPGRASNSPTLDFLITMLQMGRINYRQLLKERKENADYFKRVLKKVAKELGERLIPITPNEISFAMTLSTLLTHSLATESTSSASSNLTFLGSMLFARGLSGARVITCMATKDISGYTFNSYGAHFDNYPTPYITFACAIGMTRDEIDSAILKFRKAIKNWKTKFQFISKDQSSSG